MWLEEHAGLSRLEQKMHLGSPARAIRGAFLKVLEDQDFHCKAFWGRSNQLRTTMAAEAEQSIMIRPGHERAAAGCLRKAGYLLLATRFDTISGKLLAICSEQPGVGSMWTPIDAQSLPLPLAQALCAWFNSTLGTLGFLARRSTKLTNPSFSQADLRTLPVPDFAQCSMSELRSAYMDMKHEQVRPWKESMQDPVRSRLDMAAAATIGLDLTTVADWRRRISLEPTISNQPILPGNPQ